MAFTLVWFTPQVKAQQITICDSLCSNWSFQKMNLKAVSEESRNKIEGELGFPILWKSAFRNAHRRNFPIRQAKMIIFDGSYYLLYYQFIDSRYHENNFVILSKNFELILKGNFHSTYYKFDPEEVKRLICNKSFFVK